ncbi:MAG: type II secretion system F family protein [Actinomycetota bacterium]
MNGHAIPGITAMAGALLCGGAAAAFVSAAGTRADTTVIRRLRLPHAPRSPAGVARRIAIAVGRSRWISRMARAELARARLEAAHVRLEPDLYVGWKGVAAIVLVGAVLPAPPPAPLLAPLLAAGALAGPDVVIARLVRRRRRQIEAQLPQFLDLLAAGSTAGLSALLALRRAAASIAAPLAEELRILLARVDLGARWRPELRALASRLELADLNRAVMAMARTESLGTPLAESLRHRADEVRDSRRSRAAELARKAPVKMLFPLVFMILPAFLLLTVVPVLLSTLRSVR